jgi:hypothetical protein
MKILFTAFDIQDWGGIIQDLELKARGLTEAGHTVDICYLKCTDRDAYVRGNTTREGSYPSFFEGATVNTLAGYFGIPMVSYGSKKRLREWKRRTDKYDLVIHEIPGPNPIKKGANDTRGYWKRLYDIETPQIISAHDANFRDLYPHLIYIADKIKGISCTNQAGYKALSWFPANRAFIGAPHPVLNWDKMKPWDDRKERAVSAHVWKAWKHMDMAVRAAPYIKDTQLVMAGDGIERRYMTSVDKCKDKYKGIWAKAEKAGMDYVGMLTNKDLFKLLRNSRVVIDTSWSRKFMDLGCHFNRSIIEGYNNGCVPICVKENMGEDGFQRRMFKAGKTHFEIAHDCTSKELGQLIDHVTHLKADDAMEIVEAGRKVLLRYFDYRKSSLDFIRLAEGKPAGVYPELEHGKLNKKIRKNAERFMARLEAKSAKEKGEE